jgi:hypothetical protein
MRVLAVTLVLVAVAAAALAALVRFAPAHDGLPGRAATPKRPVVPSLAVDPAALDAAIARGVGYLVGSQNPTGSWGSPASNLWDIYAPVPGSYYAFEVAVTALAVEGLRAAAPDDAGARAAVRRGVDFLLAHHDRAKRISPDVLYNVWGHAYALDAFCSAIDAEQDPARLEALRAAAAKAVDFLARFEFVDGGWGYYNFDIVARRPEHGATSFTTGTVLVALARARARGIAVPERLVRRAVALLETCRKPDWAFAYSWEHRFHPQGGINKTNGSLARTAACVDALLHVGEDVPVARRVQALDDLALRGRFLLIARKYPIPHETWFQNSGYFCFYGYYYASDLLARVPPTVARRHARHIAATLLPLQEPDGSWWDYQLYGYHKAYGTGYLLTVLARCRPWITAP